MGVSYRGKNLNDQKNGEATSHLLSLLFLDPKAWDPLSALSYYFLSPLCPQSKISLVKFGWLVASSTLWLQASFIVRIWSNYHTTIQGAHQPTAARTSVSGYCRCHSLVCSFSLCLLQSCLPPLILTTLWKHWSLDHRTLFKLHTVYGSCGLLHQYTCTHFSRESAHCWCVSQSPHSNTSHSQIAFLLGQSCNVGHTSPARVQHLETRKGGVRSIGWCWHKSYVDNICCKMNLQWSILI